MAAAASTTPSSTLPLPKWASVAWEKAVWALITEKPVLMLFPSESIVDKKTWLDLPMRYQPYTSKLYRKLLQIFLR